MPDRVRHDKSIFSKLHYANQHSVRLGNEKLYDLFFGVLCDNCSLFEAMGWGAFRGFGSLGGVENVAVAARRLRFVLLFGGLGASRFWAGTRPAPDIV